MLRPGSTVIVWAGEARPRPGRLRPQAGREAARGPGRRQRRAACARSAASRTPGRASPRRPAGRDAAEIRDGPGGRRASRPRSCSTPTRSATSRAGPAWSEALGKAKFVLAVSMFENASTRHADVVFPAEFYAEKEGTVTHPDGRLQRLRPGVPAPGRRAARSGRCWSSSPRCSATRPGSTRARGARGDRLRGPVLRRASPTRRSAAGASAGRSATRHPRLPRRRAGARDDVPAQAAEPIADPVPRPNPPEP